MEKIKLGTILIDGCVSEPGSYCGISSDVSIGDTAPGLELVWLKHRGLLIADRCVCTNISWNELNLAGLIWGKPVFIDGKYYLCRSLSVGEGKDECNEWGFLLNTDDDETNEKVEDQLVWNDAYFWGQERVGPNKPVYAVRGFKSPWYFNGFNGDAKFWQLGFRPVLENLLSPSELSEQMIGRILTLYGPGDMSVAGKVIGVDNYDLVLTPNFLPSSCEWAIRCKDDMIVSRSQIFGARTE